MRPCRASLAALALLPLLLLNFSCDLNGEDDWPVVRITADVTTPTTWTAGNVYVIEVFDFSVTDTLTIQPGTIIKFRPILDPLPGPLLTLGGSGIIIAAGTSTAPIIFTSFYDDAHGGDSNDDGSATAAASRDWEHINTNGLDSSIFDYCEFYYGGGSTNTDTLSLSAGSDNVTVTHCTFAHNDGSDATGRYGVLNANGGGSGVIIQNNIFYANIRPLSISDAFNLDDSNVFHNPQNLTETNACNGIFVYTSTITGSLNWAETEVAFISEDVDWRIAAGGTLNLADDVVLKFTLDSELVLEIGAALGNYNGSGVAFTSYKDDSRKGDTNGDGAATTAADNDWGGIYQDGSGYRTWANIHFDEH